MKHIRYFYFILFVGIATGLPVAAQQNIAQEVSLIFQQNCLNCHGPHGAFTEQIVIDSAAGLIDSGAVVPGNPLQSELYTRLIAADPQKRMPLGGQLSPEAIQTIRNWIQARAPSWDVQHDVTFITPDAMLTAIQGHLGTLDAFDRPFARYFTTTHLYNAGETPEALRVYRVALSKLVNSLSWGFQIINPEPIDAAGTIFYIDLRNYEWDTRTAWTQIENEYPYAIEFDADTQAGLLAKLANLRQEMACEVPYVYANWFLATASLPPLYHDILALPETEQALERELRIDVDRNIQSAPGVRVWRAGTNNSGVSNHNRVVERHTSPYGAYWKSHDFAGSAGAQNIFTHPLSFQRDGGEVIFNLPNGLQAYYIADGFGNRIDVAPTEIVSNPAASDPAVRNGLSCIGCHTEGMKDFEDEVRSVVEQTLSPAYNKDHTLRLYVEPKVINTLVSQDTERYRVALEATGGVFGGIEPVHRFYEVYQGPISVDYAAAAVGMEVSAFILEISAKSSLQHLGLTALASGGSVKRDVWTSQFSEVISALQSPDISAPFQEPVVDRVLPTPSGVVSIPDVNLRAVILEALAKSPRSMLTPEDMEKLKHIKAEARGIRDLTGLEYATNLERIEFQRNHISDLTPLAGLRRTTRIELDGNHITDVSPLGNLFNLTRLELKENAISDLSPLSRLLRLKEIQISGNPVSDLSPLTGLISLTEIEVWDTGVSDLSPLANLRGLIRLEFGNNPSISQLRSLKDFKVLRELEISDCENLSDISGLAELTQLTKLNLERNLISDLSPLANLKALTELDLSGNNISDISPLAGLSKLNALELNGNSISDFSPLESLSQTINVRAEGNPGTFLRGGPKIVGPWVWSVMLGTQLDTFRNTDMLARVSGGDVTEREVATNGVMDGEKVGDRVWTAHKISGESGGHNINDLVKALGISERDGDDLIYGAVTLDSPREQKTKMFAGSDNDHKIWLNGELVNQKYDYSVSDYQLSFPVTLKQGKNVLLVAVRSEGNGWSGHFGFAPDAEYTVLPPGSYFTLSTETAEIQTGSTFTLHLTGKNITDLAGWQTDIVFDPALLKANRVIEGTFLKQGNGKTFFQKGTIKNKQGKITGIKSARVSPGGGTGEGVLLSVRFTALARGTGRVGLRNFRVGTSTGQVILSTRPETVIVVQADVPISPRWDVNQDGITDATDVQLVTAALGEKPPKNPRTDVNSDGVVDGKDIAIVAEHLGEKTALAAPMLRPEETALLANYPNPFNPETWIPYQLAESAEVTVHIYTANGALVRTLALGHQTAGIIRVGAVRCIGMARTKSVSRWRVVFISIHSLRVISRRPARC